LNVLIHNRSSKSIQNSEFGTRYSWLLPIGNGLQMSFIYLYVARFGKLQFDPSNNPSAPFYLGNRGANAVQLTPGIWYVPTQSWPNIPGGIPYLGPGGSLASSLPLLLANGVTSPARLGTLAALVDGYTPRSNSFHVTGTYYDKDLTDMVFRYDFSYRPRVAFFRANPMNSLAQTLQQSLQGTHPKGSLWKEEALFLLGCDRPTYIPWISKQHTFLVLQNTLNYFPDRPKGAGGLGVGGRIREIQDLVFFAAVNWMMDGRWAATNVAVWDIDDNVGELISTNSFRYSRNVLLGVNVQWYLGRSGRSTDPFLFSHDQRINELELRATYEI
jgi:hypothetical protein